MLTARPPRPCSWAGRNWPAWHLRDPQVRCTWALFLAMAEELANDILTVSGVKTAYDADEADPENPDD
jgi:hypothetical protein